MPLSQGSSTPDEPPHYSLGGAKGGHDSSSSVHGAGAPPLTARTASSAASSQLSGRFFDQTSTAEKGRYRVHDARSVLPLPLFVVGLSHPSVPLTPCPCGFASLSLSLSCFTNPLIHRDFDTKSMFRKPDLLNDAVTLLMGKKRSSGAMDIITVLFDRAKFSEEGARIWWQENQDRLLLGQW